MSNPNFSAMTDEELRTYVLHNRQDTMVFYAYVDPMQQRPPIAVIEPGEWSEKRMQQIFTEKERKII